MKGGNEAFISISLPICPYVAFLSLKILPLAKRCFDGIL